MEKSFEYTLLVVEDDKNMLEIINYNLSKEGYKVITASDGIQAIETARSKKPDIIILDIMLPKLDGLEVCRRLRYDLTTPILMLTARAEEIDKILGLEVGADDYMTKPFSMRELLARIKAITRRLEMTKQEPKILDVIKAGDIEIDPGRHMALNRGLKLNLSPKEFDLLIFLVKNRRQVFSRDQLLDKIWGYDSSIETRTVDVHIRWLRQKIEVDPVNPKHLLTIHGVGYKFEE
ncbi:MAG: response regulator transcription factor [Chloroflexi bacterium]|nr:response regulator transcription factor [Chloroflexota bacterium]